MEILGQGLLYSLNYDHRFTEHLGWRLGITHFTWSESGQSNDGLTAIPILGELLVGSRGRYLELAVGVLLAHGRFIHRLQTLYQNQDWTITATGTIGLRFQPASHGLIFRLSVVPFVSRDDMLLWPGLSIGYAF